jgi:hypothetical protein
MNYELKYSPIDRKPCSNCKEILPSKMFSFTDGLGSSLRSHCKKCRSKIIGRKFKEKKAEEFPHLYWDCDACDNINHMRLKSCVCGFNRMGKGSNI